MKHHFYRTFVSLLIAGGLFTAGIPVVADEQTERAPVYLEKLTIILEGQDVVQQEGIREWADKAGQVVTKYFPIFDKLLETEGFLPETEISIVFRKMDGVAFASGTQIVISADWIRRQPGDLGMVAHELVHVIQRYPGRGQGQGLPFWAMEGLTDYIRHVHFEPEVPMRPVDPDRANYTDAYQITGGFFMYIVDTYDRDFIVKLNEMGRKRTYSEDIFEASTGKALTDIWAEYAEVVLRPLHEQNQRIVPAERFPNMMQYKKEFDERVAALKPDPQQQQQPAPPRQRRGSPVL